MAAARKIAAILLAPMYVVESGFPITSTFPKALIAGTDFTNALNFLRSLPEPSVPMCNKSFCGGKEANPDVQLALVRFNVHGNLSPYVVQRGGWVTNVDCFLEKLSAMDFSGGGFCDAAIAEGLSEVLKMCPPPNEGQTQQNNGFRRHCILVAGSNPFPLPTIVYRPPDDGEAQAKSSSYDAETLVKSFKQCHVSLSVICPRQLLKLKSIYNAGKRNHTAVDYTIDIVTNPHYLVLISEDFKSALVDVNRLGIKTLPSVHSTSNTKGASVSGTSSSCSSSEWKSVPVQFIRCPSAYYDSSITVMAEPATSSEATQVAKNTTHGLITSDIFDMSWSLILHMSNQKDPKFGQHANKKMKVSVQYDIPGTGRMMPAASSLQSSDSGYVKVWEAYQNSTASTFEGLLGKVDRLAFVAMNQHEIFEAMKQHNVCAVIRLPSHVLMLSISDPGTTWFGTLFPNEEMVNLETGTSGQQPLLSQQQSAATRKG
ncbi:hypothetical protein E3N88_01909 [Mikania micrantha]|uniref:Mediator of RNA polymerase II transcription subunit 25 n=1 Tax=Mikania micrantha TaxID=192012 RepID=A0A5N6Q2T8_9ASTR|nr:hypothetical protein E3N88_01909 [Mikania micrantha]